MANKISTVLDAIETGLGNIDGLTVVRRAVRPFREPNLPAAGIVVDGSPREVEAEDWSKWPVAVLIGLLVRKGDQDQDAAILDLVSEALVAVKAVADSDAPGGLIDQPRFSLWAAAQASDEKPLALVGAVIELRVTVEGPLVVEEEA